MKHIYKCAVLNRNPLKYEFNKIYNGKLLEQIEIMKRFEENIERNNFLNPR